MNILRISVLCLASQETADTWSKLMDEVVFSATADGGQGIPGGSALQLGDGFVEEKDESEADLEEAMTLLRDRLNKCIKMGRAVKSHAIKAVENGQLRNTRRDEIESALMEVVGQLADVEHILEFRRTRDGTMWSKPLVVEMSKKAGEAADNLSDVTKIVKVLLPKAQQQ